LLAVAGAAGFVSSGGARSAAAPVNTGLPVVSGTAQDGQTLSTTTGTWTGTVDSYSYAWLQCDSGGNNCSQIPNRNRSTITLQTGEVGHTIEAQVTAKNSSGSTTATSARTAVVAAQPKPVNSGLPQVSGSTTVGATLTTTNGTWTNPVNSYGYAWQRCDSNGNNCSTIGGAGSQSYVLVGADSGHTLEAVVTASNSGGSTSATSAHTAVVTAGSKPVNTALPAISGTTTVGSTLTTSTGTWTSATTITYTYVWQRCDSNGNNCAAISGATSQTYVLTAADVGHKLRSVVTATNAAGGTSATSSPSAAITASAPAVTTAPAISGTTKEGSTLTVSTGTWAGATPITYSYIWHRCDANSSNCASINGATAQAYVLTASDVNRYIRVQVTATNSVGSAHTLSNLVGPITSGLPAGATRLPNGDISIPAANVPDTDRLLIKSVSFSPRSVRPRGSVTATFKVIDSNTNYVVAGALVYVLPIPYNFARATEQATGVDGSVAITLTLTKAAPRKGALIIFVRARTPQGNKLAGSSTRRLVQVLIKP
jgi:Ig domain of plant-specific actin-binding protein